MNKGVGFGLRMMNNFSYKRLPLMLFFSLWISLVNSFAQEPLPRDTSYTVHSTYKKLIKDYPEIKPVSPIQAGDVVQLNDIVFLTLAETPFGRRDLHADVSMPADKSRLYPGVIIVHGGGWRSGNRSMNTPLAQQLARNGFVCVSVEYRLSLEAKYPTAMHDLKAAIRWMRAHSVAYNINKDQIAIIGASAGGQLAALVGTTNNNTQFEGNLGYNEFSSSVQAVVDLDGLLDFTAPESLALQRNAYSADVFWLGGFFEDNPVRWKEASAISWVTKNSPPFLFINSKQTRFHAGCKEMMKKLEALGVYSEVQQLDAPHSYWLFHPWFNPTVKYTVEFLNRTFNSELEK